MTVVVTSLLLSLRLLGIFTPAIVSSMLSIVVLANSSLLLIFVDVVVALASSSIDLSGSGLSFSSSCSSSIESHRGGWVAYCPFHRQVLRMD